MSSLKWKSDVKQWNNLEKDTASLILNQAESLLRETVETAKTISLKAEKLITILIPLESGIVLYFIDSSKEIGFTFLNITAILTFIIIGLSLYFTSKNFKHYEISVPGEFPDKILTSAFIDTVFKNDEQYLNMVFNICENLQERITINRNLNSIRTNNNRISISILFLTPICPFIAYLLCRVSEIHF
ncbi:MAG: hypothetical protein WCK67_12855 [bacterium]